jgi:hypothetical protein
LTCDTFGKYEPAGQLLGLTPEVYKAFMSLMFDDFVKQQISIVAIDEATNKVAGVFVAWDPIKFENDMGFMDAI